MTAPFITVADMPIRQSSSTVAPCTTAEWPTETPAPSVHGKPSSACSTTLSCRLVPAPTRMGAESPRAETP
ncbi:hypothetical protein GY12_10165 [Micrococcus luteus]|nr:hypothetical protein GY12_10165 [Micrococcus luteus]